MKNFIIRNFIDGEIYLIQGNFTIKEIQTAFVKYWYENNSQYELDASDYDIIEINGITNLSDLKKFL